MKLFRTTNTLLLSILLLVSILAHITVQEPRSMKAEGDFFYFYFPSYGSVTTNSASLRFYGLIYEKRDSNVLTDLITSAILDSADIDELRKNATTQAQKDNLERNLEPFLRWDLKSGEKITFLIQNVNQSVTTRDKTATDGRFDEFINVNSNVFFSNHQVFYQPVQPVDTASGTGNITLSDSPFGVVSDVDDVLRIVEVWNRKTALRNTFIEPYQVVPGMPHLFDIFQKNLTNVSFHYATTAVELNGPPYSEFLSSTYPLGSLDMRPLDITDPGAVLNARKDELQRLRDTFPSKAFILIGDNSNSNAITAFSEMARDFPSSVSCVFIRNITATYPDFSSNVDLEKEFKDVPRRKWFVFDTPQQLYDIDFASGSCHPPGVPEAQPTLSASSSIMYNISFCALMIPMLIVYATMLW